MIMNTVNKAILSALGSLLILALAVTTVYAANIVSNGDFSTLVGLQPAGWTPWAGDTFVADATWACGAGVAIGQLPMVQL